MKSFEILREKSTFGVSWDPKTDLFEKPQKKRVARSATSSPEGSIVESAARTAITATLMQVFSTTVPFPKNACFVSEILPFSMI